MIARQVGKLSLRLDIKIREYAIGQRHSRAGILPVIADC
jgi:hypothetical protein